MFSSAQYNQWPWCHDEGKQCAYGGHVYLKHKSCHLPQITLTNALTLLKTVEVLLWPWLLVPYDVQACYPIRYLPENSFPYFQKPFSLIHRLLRTLVWAGQCFHCWMIYFHGLVTKRAHQIFPLICQGGGEAQSQTLLSTEISRPVYGWAFLPL